jgi:excisionase family DNA binding protein
MNHKNIQFLLLFFLFLAGITTAQKIKIKNVDGKPVEKASVVVQVNYKALDFIFNADKEKLFNVITDTSGVVELKGEFQKDNFEVKSLSIKIKHSDYSDYNVTTQDYSTDPKFSYDIYLTLKNKDLNPKSVPSEEKRDIDIYSSAEVAAKLKIKEEDIITMIEKGELKGKKIGEKYFISGNELKKYLEK